MTTIAIIYFSGSGHTHLMAEAVAAGVRGTGSEVDLLRITGDQIVEGRWQNDSFLEKLNQADAIVFGTPTYMGGVAAQFKAFLDASSSAWFPQLWKDKIAGGFTHSASPSGDKQGTLLYLATLAAQHAMIWVGNSELPSQYVGKTDGVNRLGSFLGVMGQAPMTTGENAAQLDPGDFLTAEHYGKRIAEVAKRWSQINAAVAV